MEFDAGEPLGGLEGIGCDEEITRSKFVGVVDYDVQDRRMKVWSLLPVSASRPQFAMEGFLPSCSSNTGTGTELVL